MMLLNLLLLFVAIAFLWIGSDKLVASASRIAETIGVSELVIGLTIVAFGTSAPEFAVTLTAALKGYASISVGNIVGSNIFNLGFILGTVAIVRSVHVSRKLVQRDGTSMIVSTLILLLFFRDLVLTFAEGLALVLLLALYLCYLLVKKEPPEIDEDAGTAQRATWKDWLLLPASIAVVVLGGQLLVESASDIARGIGISEWVIGVTIVAAGTSAPEMATSLAAVIKGKHGISAGNLVGSNLFNIMGVLGLAGMLRPLTILQSSYYSLLLLTLMVMLAVVFMRTGWRVSRAEGVLLVLSGLFLWTFDFLK
ncbi:calcium/sodium antiporter [Desulfatitalea tepidiphila]|uniref:calcium/sodium antiporter n=1 Tax=Desulfatitalea tepidiphila TaxID=1185843 RepID=UPI000AA619C8|nr:calcium/sodium antiporter [Desulfatitalea tepidiphila]